MRSPSPPASDPAAEIAAFQRLQAELRTHFERFRSDSRQRYTTVVVPSQSFDPVELAKIDGVAHYEERLLFYLMLLRYPRLQLVYVTSKQLDPLIVDYYLHQMRGVPSEHARRRLHLFHCDDSSPRALTSKVLERPLLLRRIGEQIHDRSMAHLAVFNSTPLERSLAVRLGIPVNACDPGLAALGTKTGSRDIFRAAGLPLLPGREGLRDTSDLVAGLADLWAAEPATRRIVVKLNDSFSGEGNAILDLGPPAARLTPGAGAAERRRLVREALPALRYEAQNTGWESYRQQFDQMGGVCEVWLDHPQKTSPSVQMRINPLREIQVISTHDQVLSGPHGQVFEGAHFPADPSYRLALQELGRRVGVVLDRRGVVGRFGIDFLAAPGAAGARPCLHAVEINLRQGGTTHPFNTLKFITDGTYDEETGEFRTAQGQVRTYYATDRLRSPAYRGMLPFDLIDLLVLNGMHFRSDETGVIFHLLGCLSEHGKLGCTVIAPTLDEADALYRDTVRLLDRTTGRQRAPGI